VDITDGSKKGEEDDVAPQAFAKSNKMLRSPQIQEIAPKSAPPKLADNVFIFETANESDTPKRSRDQDLDSTRSPQRDAPHKKPKLTPIELMSELGRLVNDIIFQIDVKKPVVRHVNIRMKKKLQRINAIQEEVSHHLQRESSATNLNVLCTSCKLVAHQNEVSYAAVTKGPEITEAEQELLLSSSRRKQNDKKSQNAVCVSPITEPTRSEITPWQKVEKHVKLPPIRLAPSSGDIKKSRLIAR